MYNPQKYSHNLNPLIDIAKQLFQKHSKLLKWRSEPESILDLGIGDGRMTNEVILSFVPNNLKEYIGADISETMLISARKTIDHDKFSIIQIDAATKNLPDELRNRFDHIFSNFCLHSIQDIRQAFVNIRDMLKPGGQFFFNVYEKACTDEAYDTLDKGKWKKYNNHLAISPFYFHDNPMKEYEKLLESTKFINCFIFSEHLVPRFQENPLEEILTAVNLRLPFVDELDKEEYLRNYLKANKESNMINIISDNQTKEKIFELHFDITTGVASKSL